jgi:hypothetical protein
MFISIFTAGIFIYTVTTYLFTGTVTFHIFIDRVAVPIYRVIEKDGRELKPL